MALGNPPIALPLGRAVGGTTVINSGTCYRPPDRGRQRLAQRARHGPRRPRAARPADRRRRSDDRRRARADGGAGAQRGTRPRGRRRARLAGRSAARNAPGCRGACQCAIGCPNNAKGGVHLNALPEACEAGARIVTGLRVQRVLVEGGRAAGVLARRGDGSELRISRRW